jgi:hypothetical protein
MIGGFECNRVQAMPGQFEQARAGVGHQNRRMRGHDDLGIASVFYAAQEFEERELAGGRESGFRFIKKVEAVARATFFEKADEAFAVGVRQEVGRRRAYVEGCLVEIAGDREKTFGTKEPAVRDFGQPRRFESFGQVAALNFDGITMIDRAIAFAAAGIVVTCEGSNTFKQGGFSDAVFANDDRDGVIKLLFKSVFEERQTERVCCGIWDRILI